MGFQRLDAWVDAKSGKTISKAAACMQSETVRGDTKLFIGTNAKNQSNGSGRLKTNFYPANGKLPKDPGRQQSKNETKCSKYPWTSWFRGIVWNDVNLHYHRLAIV